MNCKKIDLDLEGCLDIERDSRQDVYLGFKIEGIEIAPEYTLTLFGRNKLEVGSYALTPIGDTMYWTAPKEDFTQGIMYYEILPTITTTSNWLEIKGKIISQ